MHCSRETLSTPINHNRCHNVSMLAPEGRRNVFDARPWSRFVLPRVVCLHYARTSCLAANLLNLHARELVSEVAIASSSWHPSHFKSHNAMSSKGHWHPQNYAIGSSWHWRGNSSSAHASQITPNCPGAFVDGSSGLESRPSSQSGPNPLRHSEERGWWVGQWFQSHFWVRTIELAVKEKFLKTQPDSAFEFHSTLSTPLAWVIYFRSGRPATFQTRLA